MSRLDTADLPRPPARASPRASARCSPPATRSPRTHLPRVGHLRPALRTWRRVQGFWATIVRTRPAPVGPGRAGARAAGVVRRAAGVLRRRPRRAGRRAGGGRPGGRGVDLVARADGRLHVPPAGARGADPPARRRAGRRHGHAAGPARWPPTGCEEALDVMFGGTPAVGRVPPAPPPRARRLHRHRRRRPGCSWARFVGTDPTTGDGLRRGRHPRRRRPRHRARRGGRRPGRRPGRLAVAPRRRPRHRRPRRPRQSTTASAWPSTTRSTEWSVGERRPVACSRRTTPTRRLSA